MSADPGRAAGRGGGRPIETSIARILTVGTYLSVALIVAGVFLMLAAGRSPTDPNAPGLDLGRLPADLAAWRPEGLLWAGLLVLLATPAARVAASLVAYRRTSEWAMVGVSLGILAVIALGIVAGVVLGAAPG